MLLPLITGAGVAAPACQAYVVKPAAGAWRGEAALVSHAAHRPLGAVRVDAVMTLGGWRVVWATPRDMEPGVFVFRPDGPRLRSADVWGGVTGDAEGAYRWATRLGAPATLSRCFANRLVADGP